MKNIRIIWEKTKIQPDTWLFFLFLFTFSLTLRKVILYFPIQGTFNEYAGIYIYISDILLLLTIVLWLYTILCNINDFSSMYRLWITLFKHNLSTASRSFLKFYYLSIPLILVIWSFLSISWSDNYTIAFFRSFKLLEFYLLYLFLIFRFVPHLFHVEHYAFSTYQKENQGVVKNVPRGTFSNFTGWNIFLFIIILVGFIQSLIGIAQVVIQHSIGLSLLDESLIAQNTPGVAKIVFHMERYIRAYGLFPHPNILGGYLLLSIISTLLLLKMFHTFPVTCSTWNIFNRLKHFRFTFSGSFMVVFLYLSLPIQSLALILSFSKSAILGLIITLLYIYVPRGTKSSSISEGMNLETKTCSTSTLINHDDSHYLVGNQADHPGNCSKSASLDSNVPRGTFGVITEWNNSRIRIFILLIFIIIILGILAIQDLDRNLEQSFQERLTYLNVSRVTILTNPVLGVGIGQFVWNMSKYSTIPLESWQFQSVHNVFLLIWSELGIIGLGLFIYWLYKLFTAKAILCNVYSILSIVMLLRYFKGILFGFIFIMLFDHYFWDIQQGSLMLWIVLGIITGLINLENQK